MQHTHIKTFFAKSLTLSFVAAAASQSLALNWQRQPKAELHVHLGGAYPLSYMQSIASPEDFAKLSESIQALTKPVQYNGAFRYFGDVERIIVARNAGESTAVIYQRIADGTKALCDEMIRDGVVYAEIRTGLKDYESPAGQRDISAGFSKYLEAVLAGMERCNKEQLDVRLLLSLRRNTKLDEAVETIDLAMKNQQRGIVGIDISGDSTLPGMEVIAPSVAKAKAAGLFVSLHLGENIAEIATTAAADKQLQDLTSIQPDRIGHGVFLGEGSKKWIAQHPAVAVEVCPSSSYAVSMVDAPAEHPWLVQFVQSEEGQRHPIAISTDDPLLFASNLSDEYAQLSGSVSDKVLAEINRQAFEFAFLADEEKAALVKRYFPGE